MIISETNFLPFCMKHYDNPHCSDISEFEEDLKRILHLKKLFLKYRQTGELRERLILNHIRILFNVFGKKAVDILFLRLFEYETYLKPFIQYINYLPDTLIVSGKIINTTTIESDKYIVDILKETFKSND